MPVTPAPVHSAVRFIEEIDLDYCANHLTAHLITAAGEIHFSNLKFPIRNLHPASGPPRAGSEI